MSLPFSLHGNEYLAHLRDFRDEALIESHYLGRRRRIGGFTFGIAHAHWCTEDNGTAHLIDEGIRHGRTKITRMEPTTLRLYQPRGETGTERVTFKTDIDDIGYIAVYRHMITEGSFMEIARAELTRWSDQQHGFTDPTDADRELLYTELQRGATGLYSLLGSHGGDEI